MTACRIDPAGQITHSHGMMTVLRDTQVRLALLALYALAALCLSLAHAEQAFAANPSIDRASYCLTPGETGASGSDGLILCGLCTDAIGDGLSLGPAGLEERGLRFSVPLPLASSSVAHLFPQHPLGSRAPPLSS